MDTFFVAEGNLLNSRLLGDFIYLVFRKSIFLVIPMNIQEFETSIKITIFAISS